MTSALSFYGSKMRPNYFGRPLQIIKISSEKSNLNLTKMIWSCPKQIGPNKNNLDPIQFWTVQNHFGSIEGQGIFRTIRNHIFLELTYWAHM